MEGNITGFIDYDPQQQYLFHCWMKRVEAVYEQFGFTPLHVRPFERLAALQGEGDTEKQIFEVFRADTGETTGLGLPFDHTVPLALWVAGHQQGLSFPYKRYDMGLSYRGERAKMGRYRAFVQADIDIIGRKLSLSADGECIAATTQALSALEVGPFQVKINHIGIVQKILDEHAIPLECRAAVLRAIDKLDKISPQEVLAELGKIAALPDMGPVIETFMGEYSLFDPALEARFGEATLELRNLWGLLETMGIDLERFRFSPAMVRGLAYYTGVVVETFLVGKEQYGSIASGGRYGNLVGSFSSSLQDVEGVGLSIGVTRLFDILYKTGVVPTQRTSCAHVLVGARTETLLPKAYALAALLRQGGVAVDLYSGPCKVKQILSHASALGVPYSALVMDESAFVVKQMGPQTQTEYTTLEAAVFSLLKSG